MTHALSSAVLAWDDIWPAAGEPHLDHVPLPVRFRILARGASWEVFRGQAFWGIFQSMAEANGAVRAAMLQIFTDGGAAQLRFT